MGKESLGEKITESTLWALLAKQQASSIAAKQHKKIKRLFWLC
jgi:hypothetical protein